MSGTLARRGVNGVVALAEVPTGNDGAIGDESVSGAVSRVAEALGWGDEHRGRFGQVIEPGSRVLVKPNFVMHANKGPWGIKPLVTDAALIRVVVDAALQAGADEVGEQGQSSDNRVWMSDANSVADVSWFQMTVASWCSSMPST